MQTRIIIAGLLTGVCLVANVLLARRIVSQRSAVEDGWPPQSFSCGTECLIRISWLSSSVLGLVVGFLFLPGELNSGSATRVFIAAAGAAVGFPSVLARLPGGPLDKAKLPYVYSILYFGLALLLASGYFSDS